MKPQTLLEKARSVKRPRRHTPWTVDPEEALELMLSFVRSEITARQVAIALGKPVTSRSMYVAYRCFAVLRDGISAGKITIERTRNGK